jgi:dienelactone hydrolase
MAPRVHVSPAAPLLDTALQIRLEGFAPGAIVRLRSATVDLHGRAWSADATFAATGDGTVDVATHAPLDGSYQGVEPMGLVWSMTRVPADDAAPADDPLAPAILHLEAIVDGAVVAAAAVPRLRLAPGIQRIAVREDGLVGVLFLPAGGEPHPGVMLLSGSEGGLHEDDAALLAAHGFAAFAVAYFGCDGVPAELDRIPLESFGRALSYLAARPEVRGDRLGVTGGSFGGMAALLVGATYPAVRAVASIVGSGVITQGISGGDFLEIMRADTPPWTWHGAPLPFVPNTVTPEVERQVRAGGVLRMIETFLPGLEDPELVAAATIPVERIQGSVLLISAGDDRSWPCERLSTIAKSRLDAHAHPFEYEHVHFPEAGHLISMPPYGPTTESLVPGPGVEFDLGGTPAATAAAREAAWRKTVEFLGRALAD